MHTLEASVRQLQHYRLQTADSDNSLEAKPSSPDGPPPKPKPKLGSENTEPERTELCVNQADFASAMPYHVLVDRDCKLVHCGKDL